MDTENKKLPKVKIIAISKPVGELDHLSPEELISYVARVSNPSNQLSTETAPKLLKYCIKHKHWSIFETVTVTVEIVTSRAIAAQILRHRSFTFQEFSQRYSVSTDFELYQARRQDPKNKQNSIDDMDQLDKDWFAMAQHAVWQQAESLYQQALARGVAKEVARNLLPLSTQTTMYMSGTLRSWIHYLESRCSNDTQLEHREIALAIRDQLTLQFPTVFEALKGE